MLRLIPLFCLVFIISCSKAPSDSEQSNNSGSEKAYRFAVIPKGTTHEFWKSVHAGAEKAAQEAGNVTILWKGPLLENDRVGQISVVEDFIVNQVDGIILAPLDSQALIDSVLHAVEEDIPVVIFDSGLGETDALVSYVATDNTHGGELAARAMANVLGGKGNVIMLRYNSGSESTEQREEGFLATLKAEFPQIKVLSSDEYAGTTPESSLEKAIEVLSKYEGQVNGIFAVCEPNATGTLGALRELNLTEKVKFIAFDPNADLIDGMKKNHVQGIVLQDPVTMGYEAVKAMLAHLNGEEVEKRLKTGEYVATPENMDEERMQELLEPIQVD
ncbi:MAG: substrate-binding domain-containing protein [Planctomycetaceae bacterium]|nr:substrate-binding domain-containing protein [Planctomycetaceae bacterium]